VVINVLALCYAAWNLDRSRSEALAAAQTRSHTIAAAVEQSISSNVNKIDIALQTIASATEAQGAAAPLKVEALNKLLLQQGLLFPEAEYVGIFNASGRLVTATTSKDFATLDISQRPYFRQLKSAAAQGMYIDRPLVSMVSHKWVIPFARRLNTADGQFAGIVLIPVSFDYFSRLLQRFNFSQSDTTSLRYSDLTLISRYPNAPSSLSAQAGDKHVSAALRQLVSDGSRRAFYRGPTPYDNIERANTFLRVSNAPLLIVSGVALPDYLRSWYRQLWQTVAFLVLFASLSFFMAWMVFHYWRKQLHTLVSLTESHRQLDDAQQVGLLGTYVYDFEQHCGIASASLYAIIRTPVRSAFSLKQWISLLHPDDRDEVIAQFRQATQAKAVAFSHEYRVRSRRDGSECWIANLSKFDYADDGSVRRVSGVIQNIDMRKLTEERLRLTQEVFLHSHEGIFVTDHQGLFLEINPAFTRICGFSRADIVGQTPRILSSGQHPTAFYQSMWQQLLQTGHWEGELRNRRKDGREYIQFSRISSVLDSKGRISRFICMASDVTDLREAQSRMQYLAYFDQLTGLANRASFTEQLQQALRTRQSAHQPLGVCYLDLDGFKKINDEWGLAVGNSILQQLALRLQAFVGDAGVAARISGDDFVLLLAQQPDEHTLIKAIKRVHGVVAEPVVVDKIRAKLTISTGVTIFPRDGAETPEALIRNASHAMYVAKQSGKNQMRFFDVVSERRLRENHELYARILLAFEQNEFELYYQPKVNMCSGQVIGAEALIRWNHPQNGIIPPDAFLPSIDNTEAAVLLGEWVIRQAMAQMASWAAAGLILPVSVNLSGYHLQRSDFISRLAQILDAFPQVQPDWLELEILETSAMHDLDQISRLLEACMALGVHFALDDFGTGYSSLTYLRRLPAETMKIDRSFVINMLEDPTDHALVEGIVSLAHSLQREVIAEGLESLEHAIPLLRMGCRLAQGYGIARPMPAGKIQGWVAQWRQPAIWRDLQPV
jgi:diguanylate cyclase (GGDEF)-like protein/PAS domain S-box-containing protein